jgi:hypothetical protein
MNYTAVAVERQSLRCNIPVVWPAGHREAACPFEVTRLVDDMHKGYKVIAVDVANKQDPHVHNLSMQIAPDGSRYMIKGELVQEKRWFELNRHTPPPWMAEVALTLEKHSAPQEMAMDDIPVAVRVPGTTAIPIPRLPANMQMMQKRMHLEVSDGNQVVWSGEQPPTNALVRIAGHAVVVSAAEQGGNLVLQVANPAAAPRAK